MKSFVSATRVTALALLASFVLTGCKKADAPVFDPAPGTFIDSVTVTMTSSTFGATIVYTADGTMPSCQYQHGTVYTGPITLTTTTTLKAMACALFRAESLITSGTYVVKPRETVATPEFSPAGGLYLATQSVSITSATADATIRYTNDGTDPTCSTGTSYSGPIEVAADVTLKAIGCAAEKIDSAVASAQYTIRPPAAAPVFDPAAGAYTGIQHVTLTSATSGATFRFTTDGSDPSCASGTVYGGPIEIANTLTLKAVACSPVNSDSPITSGGYEITIPPPPSTWHSVDIDNPPVFAAGTTSTNENGDAVNISGRGKFESSAQVFRFVYTSITGDFVMTARLDGVDFAGLASSQARVGLFLTPDFTQTGNNLLYGGTMVVGDGTMRRTDRIAAGAASATSNINPPAGNGVRYLKLTRTGNTYRAAISLNGDDNTATGYASGAIRTFSGVLPATLYVGFAVNSSNNTNISASATFSDVYIRDPAGNVIVAPNQFTGDIGSPTPGGPGDPGGGGGTPPAPGPSHPEDLSRGDTPAEPALVADAPRFNLEGFAAGAVTGGGNIPDSDPRYRKVTTATELKAALDAAKASGSNPVKVIEIMNDLNMGWNEIGTLAQGGLLRKNADAKKHPTLIASGVTLLDIQNFNGLTIFSRNGATIRHAEFNIKNGTNLILRNLRFDELWEWDELTKGAYDQNDWDFVTIGDGGSPTSAIWVDHCTFTKAYDGVLDIKNGANKVTISWSAVVPAASGPGSFVQQQFDFLEANRTSNTMYNLLRGAFTPEQIAAIALPQKKGHLIGATNLAADNVNFTVTLHHNYYKDLQDRMPRLRGGDVHGYNLYVDSSNARIQKDMRDSIVAANPSLASALSSTYSFSVTSQASISTEGGAVQIDSSVFYGVLTPFRNNQTDVTNPAFTGAIQGSDLLHILLATDTQFMPVTSQQSTFVDERGLTWATWHGDSSDPNSSLGPRQAPLVPFVWHNGGPMYLYSVDPVAGLGALLTGPEGAGAGKIGLTTSEWLNVAN